MFQKEYINLVFNSSKQERFNLGGCAYIYPYLPGKVRKVTKIEFDLKFEYEAMVALWRKGFYSMPKPLGISQDKNSILMEEIQDGVPLKEFLELYQRGNISEACATHIIEILQKVLSEFWSKEAVHGDLHANNILIGKDIHGAWQIWIIDFGATYFGGDYQIDRTRLKIFLDHYGVSGLSSTYL